MPIFHKDFRLVCFSFAIWTFLCVLSNMRRHLTAEEAARAVGMLEAGHSQRQVAGQFNVTQSVISRLRNRYNQTGTVQERQRSGRPRCTTAREDRYLGLIARRQRFQSAVRLNADFRQATGRRVSTQTIRNRFHASNLRACRPAVRPILTRQHRIARQHWATDHANWQLRHWTPVLFTDESRFCVDFHDGRRRVWREPGERYFACCIAEHDRFGGASVMVWAGISIGGRTDLYVIDRGPLTGVRYRDEILNPIVRPFAGAIGDDFILMDDNARPHRAMVVNQYLERETIVCMDWPSRSPDLNPIEHAWDLLQRAISSRPRLPNTRNELVQALNEEWQRIPQMSLRRLIRSMPRRCRAVVQARGGHTEY